MKSLAGHLLTASRQLRDPNFVQTVVLLMEHAESGALGVVLNRISDKTVSDVWETIEADPCDCQQPLNLGGPVTGPLIALHTSEHLGEKQVLPNLFMSLQRDLLDQLVRQLEHPFRIYSGNSGWGGGQLENELKMGGWITTPAKEEDVFTNHDELWNKVTTRIGLGIMLPGLNSENLPPDPSMN